MKFKKAELMSFNSDDYKADVRLAGSYKVYLEDVTVARNIPEGEMSAGRRVAVLFFEDNNPKEAVVVAVYT